MRKQSALVLMVLLVGAAMAAPSSSLKNKLGQVSSKSLAEQGEPPCVVVSPPPLELPECPCVFSELPGLGNGVAQGFEQRAEASQVATLTAVPDTQFTQICQSNCCECAESAHASIASATKNRTFAISGSISVIETLEFSEESQAAENSESKEEKNTICVTNNQNGGLGTLPDCINVTVCPPTSGVGLGLSTV